MSISPVALFGETYAKSLTKIGFFTVQKNIIFEIFIKVALWQLPAGAKRYSTMKMQIRWVHHIRIEEEVVSTV